MSLSIQPSTCLCPLQNADDAMHERATMITIPSRAPAQQLTMSSSSSSTETTATTTTRRKSAIIARHSNGIGRKYLGGVIQRTLVVVATLTLPTAPIAAAAAEDGTVIYSKAAADDNAAIDNRAADRVPIPSAPTKQAPAAADHNGASGGRDIDHVYSNRSVGPYQPYSITMVGRSAEKHYGSLSNSSGSVWCDGEPMVWRKCLVANNGVARCQSASIAAVSDSLCPFLIHVLLTYSSPTSTNKNSGWARKF